MDRRKTLVNEYKQRKIVGGVFKVTNTRNGSYLLDYTPNLQAKQNAFEFMATSGSCFDYKLRKDLDADGSEAFNFEIIETLEKKKDQTQDEFIADLKTLAQMWGEKLDSSKRY